MGANLVAQEQFLARDNPIEDKQKQDDVIAQAISRIISDIDRYERFTRDRMLRQWKYLELLWAGAGNYYWDYTVGQWRAITREDIAIISQQADIDPTLVNKIINLIRPYGESLIGILTTSLPRVKFFPKSAEDDLDIQAAKAYSNVEEKIVDDNMMPLRMMEILVKLWNGGFAAAYNYTHNDPKYGVVTEPNMVEGAYNQQSLICTNCGNETLGDVIPQENQVPPENENEAADDEQTPLDAPLSLDEQLGMPGGSSHPPNEPGDEIEAPELPNTVPNMCPMCGAETPHLDTNVPGFGQYQQGTVSYPKARQIINIYGPMNVKIPSMAVRPEHIFWLVLEEEIDVAQMKKLYPEHKDKILPETNSDIDIDRLARAGYEIADDTLRQCTTRRLVWLTPAAYEKLEDEDLIKQLNDQFPDGVKAVFSGAQFLEAEKEDMHEHWTISVNPLYTRIMADPLGKALIGLQETANDLFQLEVDTVRHAIPQTFVDPKAIDPKAYKQQRALPGGITFTKTISNDRKISDYFFETRSATLPQEVAELDIKVEKLFQFISGILPPVFGGPASGSKTLGEYQESKNQALQRLSITWKIVTVMYAEMMAKATKQYVDHLREDEFFVKEQGTGNFINVWIKREQFEGKLGDVRPEISDQFPMSWGQKSARVMELMNGSNQQILSLLLHPENIELIYQTLGINELYVPGEDQRNKQLYEISEMISAKGIPTGQVDPSTGQEILMPPQPVMIEPIDDDQVHIAVLTAFLNSSIGIDLKTSNPQVYANLMMHFEMHNQRLQLQMQAQAQAQAEAQAQNKGQTSQFEQVSNENS